MAECSCQIVRCCLKFTNGDKKSSNIGTSSVDNLWTAVQNTKIYTKPQKFPPPGLGKAAVAFWGENSYSIIDYPCGMRRFLCSESDLTTINTSLSRPNGF